MEQADVRKQARALIDELLKYSCAQIFDIAPTEQKLKQLQQDQPDFIEPLIGLMLAAIMQGNLLMALRLSERIWQMGGNLSLFFELLYADSLLNIGEISRAEILLSDRLSNIGPNLDIFYMVMVKYALLTGKISLLVQIGDYPNMYEQERVLFDFAQAHAFNSSTKDFQAIMSILRDNLKNLMCAVEYVMYPDGLELVFYTNAETEQNKALTSQITEKINGYFLSVQKPPFRDFYFKILNIKLHDVWMGR